MAPSGAFFIGVRPARAHSNDAKSAVGRALGRKFLRYELRVAKGREVQCSVAHKAMGHFKARIRQLTHRSGGRSMEQVVQRLRPYLLGWKACFGLAQTPKVWRELDEWLRHLQRAIHVKHSRRPRTMYRELPWLVERARLRPSGWRPTAVARGATATTCSKRC